MESYRYIEATQKDAVKVFLSGARNLLGQTMFSDLRALPKTIESESCLILWKENFQLLPFAIIAESQTLTKLLPKIMSIPSLGAPVTSYCRTWRFSDARALSRRDTSRSKSRLEGFIGLIIGELISRIGPELKLGNVSGSMARRTFSHVLANLYIAGASPEEEETAFEAWQYAAHATENQIDLDLIFSLLNLSQFIKSIPKGIKIDPVRLGQHFRTHLTELKEIDIPSQILFEDVFFLAKTIGDVSREERFELVLTLASRIADSTRDVGSEFCAQLMGYAISLIEPGSLKFVEICLDFEKKTGLKGIACSYTMCAALMSGEDFLLRESGLGCHLLTSSLYQDRAPDISFHELQIFGNTGRLNEFNPRTSFPSLLEVELIPYVSGTFFVGNRRTDSESNEKQKSYSPSIQSLSELDRIGAVISELNDSVFRLRATLLNENAAPSDQARRSNRKK